MNPKAFFPLGKKPWEKVPSAKPFLLLQKTIGKKRLTARAQAGLEYLLTYGWALVLVATIVGVFVMIVGTPADAPVFNSSQSTKFPVMGGTIDGSNKASVIVKNVTGGKITVTKITVSGTFSGCGPAPASACKFNGSLFTSAATISPAIQVISGGDLKFESITYGGTGSGTITMDYTDVHNFSRTLTITGRKGKG